MRPVVLLFCLGLAGCPSFPDPRSPDSFAGATDASVAADSQPATDLMADEWADAGPVPVTDTLTEPDMANEDAEPDQEDVEPVPSDASEPADIAEPDSKTADDSEDSPDADEPDAGDDDDILAPDDATEADEDLDEQGPEVTPTEPDGDDGDDSDEPAPEVAPTEPELPAVEPTCDGLGYFWDDFTEDRGWILSGAAVISLAEGTMTVDGPATARVQATQWDGAAELTLEFTVSPESGAGDILVGLTGGDLQVRIELAPGMVSVSLVSESEASPAIAAGVGQLLTATIVWSDTAVNLSLGGEEVSLSHVSAQATGLELSVLGQPRASFSTIELDPYPDVPGNGGLCSKSDCTPISDACARHVCNPLSGCTVLGAWPQTPCDDGDACTSDDSCEPGGCVGGAPIVCDDELSCNGQETCEAAKGCVDGLPTVCSDGDPCTADECDEQDGCVHPPGGDGKSCDDGDPCTTDDTCSAGQCAGDDDAECLCDCGDVQANLGVCEAVECLAPAYECVVVPVDDGQECSDGDACTTSDQCSGGDCVGDPLLCDDKIECTADSCDAMTGCTFQPLNGTACDDGQACTGEGTCAEGVCTAPPLDCDDNNACTLDTCGSGGCQNLELSGKDCDDGEPCTVNDECVGSACLGTDDPCDDADPCTVDSCAPGVGCQHQPATGVACSDGDSCTIGDQCNGGVCAGTPMQCTDSNVCTTGQCLAGSCLFTPVANACDDESACTTQDACVNGACQGGPAPNCDDGKVCTADSCDPATGCTHALVTGACDDGDACSVASACSADACVATVMLDCSQTGLACETASCSGAGCVPKVCANLDSDVLGAVDNKNQKDFYVGSGDGEKPVEEINNPAKDKKIDVEGDSASYWWELRFSPVSPGTLYGVTAQLDLMKEDNAFGTAKITFSVDGEVIKTHSLAVSSLSKDTPISVYVDLPLDGESSSAIEDLRIKLHVENGDKKVKWTWMKLHGQLVTQ